MAKTLVTSGTSLGGGRMSPMNPIVRRLDAADIIAPQSFLTILSKQTGGRVFMNRNDLETGIEGVRSDARTYYLVGIIPEDGSGEGPVEVRVSRAGARVLVRSDWFTRKASADELESAFRFPGFYRDFEMDTVVSVAAGTLKVSVDIPTEALVFEPELGRQRCTIQIRGRVLDAAGKWIGSGFLLAKLFPIALEETQLEALRLRPAVTAAAQARLPAGARDLIIVVRQEPSGLTATYSAGLPSAGQ